MSLIGKEISQDMIEEESQLPQWRVSALPPSKLQGRAMALSHLKNSEIFT